MADTFIVGPTSKVNLWSVCSAAITICTSYGRGALAPPRKLLFTGIWTFPEGKIQVFPFFLVSKIIYSIRLTLSRHLIIPDNGIMICPILLCSNYHTWLAFCIVHFTLFAHDMSTFLRIWYFPKYILRENSFLFWKSNFFASQFGLFQDHKNTTFEQIWVHLYSYSWKFWFQANPAYLKDSKIVLPVQVNGKTRGTIQVEETCSEDEAFRIASTDEKLSKYIDGKTIKKKIFVAGKILNVIIAPENVKVGQRW